VRQRHVQGSDIDSKSSTTIIEKRKMLRKGSEREKITRRREGSSYMRTRMGNGPIGREEEDICREW
jgi:hypothetical protein